MQLRCLRRGTHFVDQGDKSLRFKLIRWGMCKIRIFEQFPDDKDHFVDSISVARRRQLDQMLK